MREQVVTYWWGEFGWELMCWQGHLRWLSETYDIKVITRPNREFLYKDFAKEIYSFNFDGRADGFCCRGFDVKKLQPIINRIQHNKVLQPYNLGFLPNGGNHKVTDNFKKQSFVPLIANEDVGMYDIIIHARNRDLADERNWNKDKWLNLVKKLSDDGYTIAAIGSDVHDIDTVDRYYYVSMEHTVTLMNKAKIVIGPSSGPMHLASLCGTPHLVWSPEFNRRRYETLWNPLKTPVEFYGDEGWNPEPDNIHKLIKKLV